MGTTLAAIGIVTNLVSIFTSTELINMSSSADSEDDLIDDNNHIITSLQSHENAINRNEESIKEIKDHVLKLEKHLSLENRRMMFTSIYSTSDCTEQVPLIIYKECKMVYSLSLKTNFHQS